MSIYTGGMVYQSVGMAGKWSFKGCPITHCSSQITLTRLVNMIASAQPSSPSYYIYIPQNSAFMHCICILYRVPYGVYIFTELGALNVHTSPGRGQGCVYCQIRVNCAASHRLLGLCLVPLDLPRYEVCTQQWQLSHKTNSISWLP